MCDLIFVKCRPERQNTITIKTPYLSTEIIDYLRNSIQEGFVDFSSCLFVMEKQKFCRTSQVNVEYTKFNFLGNFTERNILN